MIINDKEYLIHMDGRHFHCPMDVTMHFIGGKWRTVVLWYLREEKQRFSELLKLMPQITERMLSIQLKKLEEDGIIQRQVHSEKPLKVEYSLTDFGLSLIPMLDEICKWGRHVGTTKGAVYERECVLGFAPADPQHKIAGANGSGQSEIVGTSSNGPGQSQA